MPATSRLRQAHQSGTSVRRRAVLCCPPIRSSSAPAAEIVGVSVRDPAAVTVIICCQPVRSGAEGIDWAFRAPGQNGTHPMIGTVRFSLKSERTGRSGPNTGDGS
jgi:hypothetical protein